MRTNLNLSGGGTGFSRALADAELQEEIDKLPSPSASYTSEQIDNAMAELDAIQLQLDLDKLSSPSASYTSEQIEDELAELDAIIEDKDRADVAEALLQLRAEGSGRRYKLNRYGKTRRRHGKTRRHHGKTRRRRGKTGRRHGKTGRRHGKKRRTQRIR
jgi:hypothetical protein